jgi:hypothetical protein
VGPCRSVSMLRYRPAPGLPGIHRLFARARPGALDRGRTINNLSKHAMLAGEHKISTPDFTSSIDCRDSSALRRQFGIPIPTIGYRHRWWHDPSQRSRTLMTRASSNPRSDMRYEIAIRDEKDNHHD